MELWALYLNKSGVLFLLFALAQCKPDKAPGFNEDKVNAHTAAGITYVDGRPFSGSLYKLAGNLKDTLALKVFRNGREHDAWKEFYPSGKLRSLRYFNNGKKEGLYEAWWEHGTKQLEYHFHDDEYEGNCKEWLVNGILIKSMNYKKGHEQGLQQQWDSEGKIWANYEVRDGRNYGITGVKACATLWKDNNNVSAH